MSDYVGGMDRKQTVLFPETIDEYVGGENPVRFIDAFVDMLDLQEMGFTHAEPGETGRPPYNPADLLKLYIYGYLNQRRSSRKLEAECSRNVEVMWLMKKLRPDFKTIADFRKDNAECIKRVFRAFVKLCDDIGLFGKELISIDGSKFRAVNSKERNVNREKLQDRIERVDASISRYMKEMDERDSQESTDEDSLNRQSLKEKIEKAKQRKADYERMLREMEETGKTEISLTDTESRLMRTRHGLDVCYNVQAAVDSKHKLIAEYDATNNPTDYGMLASVATGAGEALDASGLEVVADKGYFDVLQLKECVDNGIRPSVPRHGAPGGIAARRGIPGPGFREDRFVYDRCTNTYTCPAGEKLTYMCDGHWKNKRFLIYGHAPCESCLYHMTACTTSSRGRRIYRWEHQEIVEEMDSRMMTAEGREKLWKRKELSEHPFGTMKRAFNQGYLLLKGLRKVKGELGLTMIAYDMRRALNTVGTAKLIAALQGSTALLHSFRQTEI